MGGRCTRAWGSNNETRRSGVQVVDVLFNSSTVVTPMTNTTIIIVVKSMVLGWDIGHLFPESRDPGLGGLHTIFPSISLPAGCRF